MRTLLIFLGFLSSSHLFAQSYAYQVLSYTDTVHSGQTIIISTQSLVDRNGPPPTFCSPIFSVEDSTYNGRIDFKLTFDLSNRWSIGCIRTDTFSIPSPTPGGHNLFFNWFAIDTTHSGGPLFLHRDTLNITVLNATAISENSGNPPLKLNPNPASNYFELSNSRHLRDVEVYSLSGQLVKSYSKQNRYDVSDLPNGIYVVRGIAKEVEFHQKLVVAR